MNDMEKTLNYILLSVYEKELEEIQTQTRIFLENKIKEENKSYDAISILSKGCYSPFFPFILIPRGFFKRHSYKSIYPLQSSDNPELYEKLCRIDDEIIFVLQFITYCSFQLDDPPSLEWIYNFFPKIVRDKLAPYLPCAELNIPEKDKALYQKFKELIQVNAVKSYILS